MCDSDSVKSYIRQYIHNKVGNWLKGHREYAGYSLIEVEKLIELSALQLESIEAGRSDIRAHQLSRLFEVYKIPPKESSEFFFYLNLYIKYCLKYLRPEDLEGKLRND